jgi:hypothetical protein
MDWKEVKQRLEEFGELPLSKNTNSTVNSQSKLNPKDMLKVYELSKDGQMYLTEAYQKVTGMKGNSSIVKRWFDNRGWTLNYVKGSTNNQKMMESIQIDYDNRMTYEEISEKYNITLDNLESKFTVGHLKRRPAESVIFSKIIELIKEGKTNQEIYEYFHDQKMETKKETLYTYVWKLRKKTNIPNPTTK